MQCTPVGGAHSFLFPPVSAIAKLARINLLLKRISMEIISAIYVLELTARHN